MRPRVQAHLQCKKCNKSLNGKSVLSTCQETFNTGYSSFNTGYSRPLKKEEHAGRRGHVRRFTKKNTIKAQTYLIRRPFFFCVWSWRTLPRFASGKNDEHFFLFPVSFQVFKQEGGGIADDVAAVVDSFWQTTFVRE